MSENIIVAATGNTYHMNLTIADKGEGQTPAKMPDTILSLNKDNKLRVPFVQGKFNMGGTGVLRFCGKQHLQLVISKRCPDIPNIDNDDTFDQWSVTIVRREPAREGRKSSMFTYLTEQDRTLMSFRADSLPILPSPQGKGYQKMTYGTYFKLFNYSLQSYKTNIVFDFNYRMATFMPELAHPIRLKECRQNFEGHSLETTLSGLQIRLNDTKKNDIIEEGFPSSDAFNIEGQDIRCSIYVFKKEKDKHYKFKDGGILYTVNGQTQGTESNSFFNKVNLSYLADSLLVLVDCSDIDIDHYEDMFMNCRDRLCDDGKFKIKVKEQIKEILKDHPGLKELQNKRRAAAVQEKLSDDKPLQDVLQNILKKSPVLSKIMLFGDRLTMPFNMTSSAGEGTVFEGKKHPSFFSLKKSKNGVLTKPIDHDFRVQFETDAVNDYFTRPAEKGSLQLKMDGIIRSDLMKHLGLFNGTATLTVKMPDNAKIGDEHVFQTVIIDDCITQSFENEFHLNISEPKGDYSRGQSGTRTPPEDKKKKGVRQNPNEAAMPNIIEIDKEDWDKYEMDKNSALVVRSTDEGSDYYLNMANQYLLTELKVIRDKDQINLTKAKYKYSMALIGMSIESYYKTLEQDKPIDVEQDNSIDVPAEVGKISTMLAPILVPMLESMAELNIEEI